MFLFAAAAITVSSAHGPSPAPMSAVVQARASVSIVSAARLHWGEERRAADIPPARTTLVQTVNGPQPAELIEFE